VNRRRFLGTAGAAAASMPPPGWVWPLLRRKFNSPTWHFDEATFDRKRLAQAPTTAIPTITLDGEFDPFTPAGDGALYRKHFTGKYAHRTLKVGHNVPQEAPHHFAQAVVEVDRY